MIDWGNEGEILPEELRLHSSKKGKVYRYSLGGSYTRCWKFTFAHL